MDHLMKGSFATLCREFKENTTSAAGGALPQSMMHHNTIGGYKVRSKRSPNSSTEVSPLKDQELHGSSRTLPRWILNLMFWFHEKKNISHDFKNIIGQVNKQVMKSVIVNSFWDLIFTLYFCLLMYSWRFNVIFGYF